MTNKLTQKKEAVISGFFSEFILSFKTAFAENFGSNVAQNIEIGLKSVQFLKDIAGLEKVNYSVSKRLYKLEDSTVQMYALYSTPFIAALSDIATGGSGDVKLDGKITELQLNASIDSLNACYKNILTLFYDNYKEWLNETGVENIYHGTSAYKTIFEKNDFVVIYFVRLNNNVVLNVPVLFKYQEIESLLFRLRLLKVEKPFDKSLYKKNLNLLGSTKIPLSVEFGKTRLPFMNVLELDRGSLVKLDRKEGDPVDIIAEKNVKIAEGKIVAVGKYFGVMITKLMGEEDDRQSESFEEESEEIEIAQSESPVKDQKPGKLTFNTEKFVGLCMNVAKMMQYNEQEMEILKTSAQYLYAECVNFAAKNAEKPDFFSKVIAAGIKKAEEKGLGSEVVNSIKYCRQIYTSDHNIDESFITPYSHILSLAISYDRLMAKYNDKGACLDILRKNGVNYFNVFVLHRFINYMRNSQY